MATTNLQIPDIVSTQDQKYVTANEAHDDLDNAMNATVSKTITGADSLTATESRENTVVKLTGTPAADFTLNMADTNKRWLTIHNTTGRTATLRNSAGGGVTITLFTGFLCVFYYDGTDLTEIINNFPGIVHQGTNLIINGDFRVAQRGTSFTAVTVPLNSDDTYLLDRWVLLSDGNDVVDVTHGTDGAVGNATYIQAEIETTALKFGFLTIIENKDIHALLGEDKVVSLSFNATVDNDTKLSRVKAMILSWTGTADEPTSDIVNAWGVQGTSPTVVTNWTIEGDSGDLNVTSTDTRYKMTNVAIDASGVTNVAVFIWVDDVADNDTLGSLLRITDVQLEVGPDATEFESRPIAEELILCQRYLMVFEGTTSADRFTLGHSISTTVAQIILPFMVEMRGEPALTISAAGDFDLRRAGGVPQAVTILVLLNTTTKAATLTATVASGLSIGASTQLTADQTTAKLTFEVEL